MPNYSNPGGGSEMDSLYSDEPETPAQTPEKESVDQEEAEMAKNTALVPLKVLEGPGGEPVKEGDEIVLQIVKMYDDEAEVKYAPKKGSEDKGGESEEPGGVDNYAKDFAAMDKETA